MGQIMVKLYVAKGYFNKFQYIEKVPLPKDQEIYEKAKKQLEVIYWSSMNDLRALERVSVWFTLVENGKTDSSNCTFLKDNLCNLINVSDSFAKHLDRTTSLSINENANVAQLVGDFWGTPGDADPDASGDGPTVEEVD